MSIYTVEERIAPSVEGTIIDFETIGSFNNASKNCERYRGIKPVIFGVLEKDQIRISYIRDEHAIIKLLNVIRHDLLELTRPLYAYNCAFERCIISNCLGLNCEFRELQVIPYMPKKKAVEQYGISNYNDPFNDNGKLCLEAWQKGHFDLCVQHNRACLLKERDILKKLNG
ncbi:MAG: hypothetical protein ACTSRC_07310 [Candidatus Helarchaeota archaeon]